MNKALFCFNQKNIKQVEINASLMTVKEQSHSHGNEVENIVLIQ